MPSVDIRGGMVVQKLQPIEIPSVSSKTMPPTDNIHYEEVSVTQSTPRSVSQSKLEMRRKFSGVDSQAKRSSVQMYINPANTNSYESILYVGSEGFKDGSKLLTKLKSNETPQGYAVEADEKSKLILELGDCFCCTTVRLFCYSFLC